MLSHPLNGLLVAFWASRLLKLSVHCLHEWVVRVHTFALLFVIGCDLGLKRALSQLLVISCLELTPCQLHLLGLAFLCIKRLGSNRLRCWFGRLWFTIDY